MSVDLVVLLPFLLLLLLLVECSVDAFLHFVVVSFLIVLILVAQIESVALLPTGHSFGLIVLHLLCCFVLVEAILLICVNISYSQNKRPLLVAH